MNISVQTNISFKLFNIKLKAAEKECLCFYSLKQELWK